MEIRLSAMAVATDEPTQVRLLDAAERLIGERGVDAVSLRAINGEAGSNVAAVHYHFGSKEALVRAVLDRRMTALAEERAAGLDQLDADPAPSPKAVATVFVDPLVDLAADTDGVHYVRFLAALYRAEGPWLHVLDEAFAPQAARINPLFARALPALDDDRRRHRLDVASETMLRMLADADRYAGTLGPEAYRAEVIDTFTAILAGSPQSQEGP
jgi:AcrR family transcriptional regulator